MPAHKNNIVIGAGKVYLALFDSAGNRGGFRYIGDTPGFSITTATERVTVFGSDYSTRDKLVDKVIQVDRSFALTVRDITPQNAALFYGGEATELTQALATAATFDVLNVQPGLWYLIGDANNKTGVRAITSVSVADKTTSDAHAEGTDYELDAATGRIYIIEGGGIAAGDDIVVTYDAPASTRSQVTTGKEASRKAALLMVADNAEGDNSDVLIPYCDVGPDGEHAFKDLENPVELNFIGQIIKLDSATEMIYIDGQPA